MLEDNLRPQYQRELPLRFGCEILANTIHVWASYRESKLICQVEASLTDCLEQTQWPDNAPIQVLQLPFPCIILELLWRGIEHPKQSGDPTGRPYACTRVARMRTCIGLVKAAERLAYDFCCLFCENREAYRRARESPVDSN
jgi:hypothetical protein